MTTLTIEQALALASVLNSGQQKPAAPMIDGGRRKVIVRSRDAGVQYGELIGYEGSTVHLANARQMWSWTAAQGGTLLDCATHGVKAGKFSTAAPAVTVIGACAIIDVQQAAIASLESAKWA